MNKPKQPSTPALPLQETRYDRWINLTTYLLLAVTALFFSLREIYGEDIPFHLHAGKWIIENLSFPSKDAFTYTASSHDYIDLNWLYQVFMYAVYSLGGGVALVLINSLLILCTCYISYRRCADSRSPFLPWILLAFLIAISTIMEVRPHSVSWIFLGLSLYLLQQFFIGNHKALRWLPLIMLVWVNCHSLFILGLVVAGCYGVSIFLRKKEQLKEFLKWSSLSVIACFFNPYGWKGVAYPFEQILLLQKGNVFKENIRELQSPFSITDYTPTIENLFSSWHFFDLCVLLFAVALILRFKKLHIHEWLIVLVFFYFAWSATKNIGYFLIAVLPFVAKSFYELYEARKNNKIKKQTNLFLQKIPRYGAISFLVISLLLILAIRSNAFYIHYKSIYRFGAGWSESNLPVKAVDFLTKNNLKGKLLNQLDLGGYIGFFTGQKVAIDGRLEVMGAELFSEQVNVATPESKEALLKKYEPDIVIFSYYITPDWIPYLRDRQDWRLTYVDGSTAIYLKNGYAEQVSAADERMITNGLKEYTDAEIDKMLRRSNSSVFSGLFKTQYYPDDELNKAFFCVYYNWVPAAKQITALGLEKATDIYPELYQNFGTIYYQYRDKERALFCYQKFLEKRKNEAIQKRVDHLKSL